LAQSSLITSFILKLTKAPTTRLSKSHENKINQLLVNSEKQIFKTNTWLWNEDIFQYSTILSIDPQSNRLETESLVFFGNKNPDNRNENTKCLILLNNERMIIVKASEIFFMV
jgi:hypothetical protein